MDIYPIQGEIEDLLRQRMGLNPDSIGSRSILRVVRKEMRSSGVKDFPDYLTKLKNSPALFEALVESIVIRETSFFRHRPAFTFLRQWVAQTWKRNALSNFPAGAAGGQFPTRPLRVLSMPCSTGEEPYSIAIALLDEGLSLDEFEVTGMDISAMAIAKAKQGIYSPYAFRQQTQHGNNKYFKVSQLDSQQTNHRYCLHNSLRQKIVFRQGNILNPYLLANEPTYDIIFCRNLLIYFDQVARTQTFAFLHRMLNPQGLLFVGYAETNLIDPALYKPVAYPQTFAYQKQAQAQSGCLHRRPQHFLTVVQPVEQLPESSFLADHSEKNSAVRSSTGLSADRPVGESVDLLVSSPELNPI